MITNRVYLPTRFSLGDFICYWGRTGNFLVFLSKVLIFPQMTWFSCLGADRGRRDLPQFLNPLIFAYFGYFQYFWKFCPKRSHLTFFPKIWFDFSQKDFFCCFLGSSIGFRNHVLSNCENFDFSKTTKGNLRSNCPNLAYWPSVSGTQPTFY